MSTDPNRPRAKRSEVALGSTLTALGLLIVVSTGIYLWNENVWIGSVGSAGADSPSSIPLYLDGLLGLTVVAIGLVVALRGRGGRP